MQIVPVTLIDSVHATCRNIPVTTPKAGGYATGTPDVRWTNEDWAHFSGSGQVRIDQEPGIGVPFASDIKDIETGAALIEDWIGWAQARMLNPADRGGPLFSPCYVSASRLGQVRLAADRAGLPPARIGYGIADWDLDEAAAAALLGGDVVWVQWASPASNPRTIVPGSSPPVTLAEANVDLGVTVHWWHPQPGPAWEHQAAAEARYLTSLTRDAARAAARLDQLLASHAG